MIHKTKESPPPETPATVDDKKRIEDLIRGLEWLRDEVVHGNEKHVKKINNIIRGY